MISSFLMNDWLNAWLNDLVMNTWLSALLEMNEPVDALMMLGMILSHCLHQPFLTIGLL